GSWGGFWGMARTFEQAATRFNNDPMRIGKPVVSRTSEGYITIGKLYYDAQGKPTTIAGISGFAVTIFVGNSKKNNVGANTEGMNLSSQGLQFIADHEGFGNNGINPYNDAFGFATAGYGHLLHKSGVTAADIAQYRGMTKIQGLSLLKVDAQSRVASVNSLVKVSLTQYQFDAMVSFTFNVGVGAFSRSTLLRELNANNFDAIPAQLARWTNGGVSGLVDRRADEINLFLHGKY
ncbi:lysozyme, partial [Pararcticibacter amylolyticus]